jgi:hypothetical protein
LAETNWIKFPDPAFQVNGLAWFKENAPSLQRLPNRAQAIVPNKVWTKQKAPAGARIRFSSDTSQLKIQVQAISVSTKSVIAATGRNRIDVYVDGVCYRSVVIGTERIKEYLLLENVPPIKKSITIYLPQYQQLKILAIGVDENSEIKPAPAFKLKKPVVFYGSSVLQGAGASHPAMAYPAIVARKLNLDHINLGFGGGGRAEPQVVNLLNEIDACCFVLDLGKSYGTQDSDVYLEMLKSIRASHPDTPIICITPIFSTRELYQKDYIKLSNHTRQIMRHAANNLIKAGDKNIHLIEGLDLLGPNDADALYDTVHPSDLGYQKISEILIPKLQTIILKNSQI